MKFSTLLRLIVSSALMCTFLLSTVSGSAKEKVGKLPKASLAQHQFLTVEGKRFSLEELRGQVVILHFFGTWCGYSKAQAGSFRRSVESGLPAGVHLIGMSVKDARSNPRLLQQFIKEQQINYPVVGEVEDRFFSGLIDSLDVSVPQTLIFGRDGQLVGHFNGYNKQINDAVWEAVKREAGKKG